MKIAEEKVEEVIDEYASLGKQIFLMLNNENIEPQEAYFLLLAMVKSYPLFKENKEFTKEYLFEWQHTLN